MLFTILCTALTPEKEKLLMHKFNTIAVVGVGLIGASLAAAFKKLDCNIQLIGVDRDSSSIRKAEDLKIIDKGFTEIKDNLKEADLIFIAVPVSKIEGVIKEIDQGSSRKQLLVDAGSTKVEVIEAAEKILADSSKTFIGAHPMAGSHNSGIDWHNSELFKGAPFILTPVISSADEGAEAEQILAELSQEKKEQLLELKNLIKAIGAKCYILSAEEHDKCTALLSHLPHLLSSALVNLLAEEDDYKALNRLSGNGFKDMTRIAGSSAELWEDIILSNRKNLVLLIDQYIEELSHLKADLENNQHSKVFAFLDKAAKIKRKLDN